MPTLTRKPKAAPPDPERIYQAWQSFRTARRLNPGQLHDLVQGATDQGRTLVAVLAYTGLRLSEALALTWADVDMVDGKISVTRQMGEDGRPTTRLKSESSRREVPIRSQLSTVLTAQLARHVAVGRATPLIRC